MRSRQGGKYCRSTTIGAHPGRARSSTAWASWALNNDHELLAAVQKGPLPPAALDRLSVLQQAFAGEGLW